MSLKKTAQEGKMRTEPKISAQGCAGGAAEHNYPHKSRIAAQPLPPL
jgi:hypothetical protein